MPNVIQLRAMPMLAAGMCLLSVLGCHKAPPPNDAMTLEELNRALSLLPGPKTIEALTNFPGVKGRPLPILPAGKRFIIDRATGTIVVGDE